MRSQAPGPSVIVQASGVGGQTQDVELYGPPGLLSSPVADFRLVVLPVGGSRREAVAVAGHYYALDLEPASGDAILYSVDSSGTVKAKVHLSNSGDVTVEAEGDVTVEAGGDLKLQGDATGLVRFQQLDSALQSLVTAINSALASKLDSPGSPGALSLDLSAAETPTIKTE